ncbi:MAG: exopolysaccharide biosynthesis polyprenyl glycosylphosphotransferase [Solirubrobacterales bacterium]|nr:exopolysaccharide biosynthesis polyprenyl glycosylphosphotransferase [Solirubrobacterales bacterium]
MSVLASSVTEHLSHPASATVPEQREAAVAYDRRAARQRRIRTYRFFDLAMLFAAGAVAVVAAPGGTELAQLAWAALYAAAAIGILQVRGFYRPRFQDEAIDALARIFAATSIAAMVLTLLGTLIGDEMLTQDTLRLWIFGLVFLGAGRVGLTIDRRRSLRRGEGGWNTLIIGAGSVGHTVADRLVDSPELGLRPIGFLDKDPLIDKSDDPDALPVLGASWDLARVVEEERVDQVIVTFSTAPHSVMLDLIRRCRDLGVEVAVIPRLFENVSNRVEVEHLGGVPLLRASTVDPRGWQFSIKYAIDRVVAAVALVALAPLLAALALAVRLSSPGRILYRQPRIGLDGQEFDILKFRSMREPAVGAATDDYVPEEGMAPGGVEGDDRRTAVGELMRRLSLDELPQLVNVLRGEMSLVGPRPERTSYVRSFEQHVYRYGDRHRVKSGITGWAQVQGLRGQTSLADRVEWDNYYIENWGLWLDFKIVVKTIPALLGRSSAE